MGVGSEANGLNDILTPSLLVGGGAGGGGCEMPTPGMLMGGIAIGEEEACVAGAGSVLATDLIRSKTRARVWPSVAALR